MSLESLKENIKYEKEIINEVALFSSQLEQAKLNNQVDDEKLLGRTITSLFKLLEIINKSLPQILMVLGVPEQVETKVEKEELKDEYDLEEYETGRVYMVEHPFSPNLVVQINTHLTTEELAKRNFGREGAIREHPILYAVKLNAVPELIRRFPLFGASPYLMHIEYGEK